MRARDSLLTNFIGTQVGRVLDALDKSSRAKPRPSNGTADARNRTTDVPPEARPRSRAVGGAAGDAAGSLLIAWMHRNPAFARPTAQHLAISRQHERTGMYADGPKWCMIELDEARDAPPAHPRATRGGISMYSI